MFLKVSCHFVDAPDPLRKLVSGCIWLNVSEFKDSRHTTWKISMHSFRSKTHILGICTRFRCSKTSVWFRTTFFMSKTRVLGGFTHFVATPDPLWKSVRGAFNARVYASETISCFVATNMPNPLFQSKTHVLGGSMPFCSRTWHIAKTGIKAHLMHEFVPLEPFHFFLQPTCPIHYFRFKTQVLDGFVPFCCRTWPNAKISFGVHLKHELVPRKPFLVWSQRTCSIHNLGLKLMFSKVSCHFVDAPDLLRKLVLACIWLNVLE